MMAIRPSSTGGPLPPAQVSLGDVGESKDCTQTKQLYAGTSECFKLVREYLDGFGQPYNVVGGNHDLEVSVRPQSISRIQANGLRVSM
jgi:hypothetical protein